MALEFAHGAIQWLSTDPLNTDYTVSGLSFQPKAIRFYWNGIQSATSSFTGTVNSRRGVGFAASTSSRRCVSTFDQDAAGTSVCASVRVSTGVAATITTATLDGRLDIQAINSDGFVVRSVDVPPVNVTVFWEAWGGSDITNVTVGDIDEPAATGTQNYTATGFTAAGTNQAVMLAGCQSTAATGTVQAEASGLFVAFTTGTSNDNNIIATGNADHGSGTADTDRWGGSGVCVGQVALAGGNLTATGQLSAFGTDQFTINWSQRTTTNRRSIYMAIKGGSWRAADYTIANNAIGNTATVSGLPFTPKGICFIGCQTTESTGSTTATEDKLSLGTCSSTSSRRSMGHWSVDTPTLMEVNLGVDYDSVLTFPTTAGTVDALYDIDAINSDGFRIRVDDDSAFSNVAEWQGYLAFGDEPGQDTPELYGRPFGVKGQQQMQQLLSQ